jgi:predicted AAA+ superfamily ATPase
LISRTQTFQLAGGQGYNQPVPPALYPRLAERKLREALADSPVVLVHGPRQCGKTTLARMVGDRAGFAYVSFDDAASRASARADPMGFVASLPRRSILDEVQHVPGLFSAIKHSVDQDRRPGRLMLTGSSNVLLVPALSDSLAGRMEILRLHPLAQVELEGGKPVFLDRLFGTGFGFAQGQRLGRDLLRRVIAGGYPPATARSSPARRAAWHRSYLDSIVQRDVRDATRISSLDVLPRLLEAAAAQTARLFNASSLGAPFQLSLPTIRDYLALLERVFLLERLPPWHSNRLSRLVKTPKLHLGDTGLAAAVLGVDLEALTDDRALLGQLLETFVFQELNRQASGREDSPRFLHFRDRDGAEVDVVIERSARELAGIEVKAGATVTEADFRGLKKLAHAAGRRFVRGIVLYDGDAALGFGDRLQAVPIRMLWAGA